MKLCFSMKREKLFFAFNRKDYNWEEMIEYYHTNDLNAGILFINSKLFNDLNIFDDIVNFYNDNANSIKYVNQSGYSYLFEKYSDRPIFTRTWSTNLAHIKILEKFGFSEHLRIKNHRGENIDTVYFALL